MVQFDFGYHIDNVGGSCSGLLSGNTYTTEPIVESCTVEASFAINTYTITSLVSGGNGTIDPAGGTAADHGSSQQYTLIPVAGFHVDQVTGTCGGSLSGTTFTTVGITGDCTVIGSFSDQYILELLFAGSGTGIVSSTPAGIDGCTTDCSAAFNDGESVTLSAVADKGSVFEGWSGGGCIGTGDCIVVIDQVWQVTAAVDKPFDFMFVVPAITK